jgi:predicted nucleic acid-binding protein
VIAADSSVIVAAFSESATGHEGSVKALRRKPRLPAHSLLESYSTLTRVPPPVRATPRSAWSYIQALLHEPPLTLSAADVPKLIEQAVAGGVIGGAIYDALIGATAKRAGATLLTRDRRAFRTYQAVGADAELVD